MRLASRLDHIEPFYVMEFAKAAVGLARSPACDPSLGGRPMIFLNIGEPDFTAPPAVQAAADAAIAAGRSQYTDATGLPSLGLCWLISIAFAALMLTAAWRIAGTRSTGDLL